MKYYEAEYLAFGGFGETPRPARTVGELPHEDRLAALKQAAKNLGIEHIYFGVPIYDTLGIKKRNAGDNDKDWELFSGEDLPLEYVNMHSRLALPCGYCPNGEAEYTGKAFYTEPLQYEHKCNYCGAETTVVDETDPFFNK